MHRYLRWLVLKAFFLCITLTLLSACALFNTPTEEEGSPKNSDWLFLIYCDADNNLNDELWKDIFYAEYGLSQLRDGSSASPLATVIVLWDGQSESEAKKWKNTRIHPEAGIYKLGSSMELSPDLQTDWWLAADTEDLTATASSWLTAEPDMGDVQTLASFLQWANNHFSSDNTVLVLNNHGNGTEFENVSGGFSAARSLCADETSSSNTILTAVDIRDAINYANIHINTIWMDCCLQGSAEIAYLLSGCADYLLASPNISYANKYDVIFRNLPNVSSGDDFGQLVVASYAYNMKSYCAKTNDNRDRTSYDTVLTQVQYSLRAELQESLYRDIDALAGLLLKDEELAVTVYDTFLKQDRSNVDNCKGMAYSATYADVNDIGYFCRNLCQASEDCNIPAEIKQAASAVSSDLTRIIQTSWMGKMGYGSFNCNAFQYDAVSENCIYQKNLSAFIELAELSQTEFTCEDCQLGLTIVTQPRLSGLWSSYSEKTGYSKNWGMLLRLWEQHISH
ncbi:MAG: hypothetical protein K6G80_11675 [Treponema sp.]|nr:hypothetical protein [Treponema sp.]